MFLSEWREFLWRLALQEKKNVMTVCVSMLLKSRASLTCFGACFLPGRAKDLSAPGIYRVLFVLFRLCIFILICFLCTSVRTTATE